MDNPLNFTDRRTILVVDDTPENLSVMNGLLRETYKVKVASSGARALAIAAAEPPDLVLLDIMMPEMDGYEVLQKLKADSKTGDIPVIFLTSLSDADDEKVGLEMGAVDYIGKPANPAILLARVRNHLELKTARDFLKDQNLYLEQEVQRRTTEVIAVQEVTIRALATLAAARDNESGNHIRRTQGYVKALALELKKHPIYGRQLGENAVDWIVKSAPALACSCVATRASTIGGLIGLVMKSAAPSASPCCSSAVPVIAVRKMIGMSRVAGACLSWRQTS